MKSFLAWFCNADPAYICHVNCLRRRRRRLGWQQITERMEWSEQRQRARENVEEMLDLIKRIKSALRICENSHAAAAQMKTDGHSFTFSFFVCVLPSLSARVQVDIIREPSAIRITHREWSFVCSILFFRLFLIVLARLPTQFSYEINLSLVIDFLCSDRERSLLRHRSALSSFFSLSLLFFVFRIKENRKSKLQYVHERAANIKHQHQHTHTWLSESRAKSLRNVCTESMAQGKMCLAFCSRFNEILIYFI